MGICFTHPTIKNIPDRQRLISHSRITRFMKLSNIHDDYNFIRVLGHGQYGAVREGRSKIESSEILEKTYAIKSILKSKMNIIMLRRELEIMSVLDHPNIVRLYETYEDEQYVHIVMDYCGGGDVAERIVYEGAFSEQESAHVMEKILGAVNYLHVHNISHRDLKAENFLYESKKIDSEIKIADFGMSAKFGDNQRMQSLAGTPYYLAPEVLKGSYTKNCDIWSLGVFMFFILSGSYPFRGGNLDEVFENVAGGKLRFDNSWAKISKEGIDLISAMLVVDPRKRISIKKALVHPWFTQHKKTRPEPVPFHIFNSLKQYKAENKLWQEALKVIVKVLSKEQIADLKKWFIAIDSNNSGSISANELEKAMKLSGYQVAEEEISEIIKNNAYLGEGRINYSDFLIATLDRKKLLNEEVLWQAFKFFDVDNDGTIGFEDMKLAFHKAGNEFTENEIDSLLMGGKLEEFENADFEKFKEIMGKRDLLKDTCQVFEINQFVRKISNDFKKVM
jgi:calcium-dependent protein kinase